MFGRDIQRRNVDGSPIDDRNRISVIPRPASIQAQPAVEGKGERAKAAREGLAIAAD
jgi:hypothetical protein